MSCHTFPPRPKWHAPKATTEHMPFKGHRTMAQIITQRESATRRASDYGFDAESLTAIADRSPKGRDFLGSVHESGGAKQSPKHSPSNLVAPYRGVGKL